MGTYSLISTPSSTSSSTSSSTPSSSPLLSPTPAANLTEPAPVDANMETSPVSSNNEALPAAPVRNTVEESHVELATSAIINLASGIIVCGLGSGRVSFEATFTKFVAVISIIVFVLSLIVTGRVVSEVWPRTYHTRMLGGLLGSSIIATVPLAFGACDGLFQTAFWAIPGCYLGFIVESVT